MTRLCLLVLVLCLTARGFAQTSLWGRTDTQKEIELGREAYEYMVKSGLRSKNEAYCRRVDRLLSQLVGSLRDKPYAFQAVVIAENDINATCLPGGYITVYEGLLTWMPDDNELAFVLAHEIGHAYRRHWARIMRKMQTDRALAIFIALFGRIEINEESLELKARAHSRSHESEADEFGTELYLRAGFDPSKVSSGMRALMEWEKKVGGNRAPEYLSTHPYISDRIRAIEKAADRLQKAGLKPIEGQDSPMASIEAMFGQIPTLASQVCQWQPVEPGMAWDYEIRAAGAVTAYRVEAVGQATVGGTAINRMKAVVGGRDVFYQLIVDADRTWRRNRPEAPASTWAVETVFPDDQGVESAGNWTFKYEGIEKIETRAGTFEGCLKLIAVDTTGRTLIQWFAPNVGLVRRLNEKAGVDEVLVAFKRP